MQKQVHDEMQRILDSAPQTLRGNRLQGKTALISGAGSAGDLIGIGAATATLFAAQGAHVGILDINEDRSRQTLALIQAIGGKATIVNADITKLEDCKAAVEKIAAATGHLDILMNNAAISRKGDIRSITEDDWDVTLAVNLKAAMFLSQAASPFLEKDGGAIVNVSSVAGRVGFGSPAYAAAKAGLEGLTRDMAVTLGRSGVRVNCIVPGFVYAPMGAKAPEQRIARANANALGIEGLAWDAAFAALYFASGESCWITGQTLMVDGGAAILGQKF